MNPDERRPRLAAKARLRLDKVTGNMLLLYPERGIELNRTAAHVLELCDGKSTLAELLRTLAAAYPYAAVPLALEVRAFIGAMVERGLVVWASP